MSCDVWLFLMCFYVLVLFVVSVVFFHRLCRSRTPADDFRAAEECQYIIGPQLTKRSERGDDSSRLMFSFVSSFPDPVTV